ncbi:MAG: hypothetical protein WAO76_05760 [Georgfuchsia sp.]
MNYRIKSVLVMLAATASYSAIAAVTADEAKQLGTTPGSPHSDDMIANGIAPTK